MMGDTGDAQVGGTCGHVVSRRMMRTIEVGRWSPEDEARADEGGSSCRERPIRRLKSRPGARYFGFVGEGERERGRQRST